MSAHYNSSWFSLIAFTVIAVGSHSIQARIVEGIAARVENDIILESEVHQAAQEQLIAEGRQDEVPTADLKAEVLEELIRDHLLEKAASSINLKIESSEIDRVIERTRTERKLTPEQLEQALSQQGMTMTSYRRMLRSQLLKGKIVQYKVRDRVTVRKSEIDRRLQSMQQSSSAQIKRVKARHILIKHKPDVSEELIQAELSALKRKIESGEISFQDAAFRNSEGPSGVNGGDLGFFGRGQMVPAFEEAAFNAQVGDIIGPIKTDFGWHIIYVEDQELGESDLGQMRERIEQQIYQEKMAVEFDAYIAELKANAYIEKTVHRPISTDLTK